MRDRHAARPARPASPWARRADATDDGESSWLSVTPTLSINNGTQGNFNPGPSPRRRLPDANGKIPLYLTATAYIGASVPSIAGTGRA